MTKLRPAFITLVALSVNNPVAAANYCAGINVKHVRPADWSHLLPFLSQYFRSNDRIDFVGSLQFGEWLIVQAKAPEHPDDPPFIFFRGRPQDSRVVWEWEGVGPDASMAAKKAIPDIPTKLADCFQWAVGNPY